MTSGGRAEAGTRAVPGAGANGGGGVDGGASAASGSSTRTSVPLSALPLPIRIRAPIEAARSTMPTRPKWPARRRPSKVVPAGRPRPSSYTLTRSTSPFTPARTTR
ncbi:hypothetical protein SMICM304S_02943 [Streptomyces microflavus]